jgi:hypothetical protein
MTTTRTDGTVGKQHSSGAVGLTVFAAVIMMLMGAFHAMAGLVGLFTNQFYVVGKEYVFSFDATTWGWIHLLLGIVVAAAGAGLLTGAVWARTVGVAFAFVSGIAAFAWLPYYPIWGITLIALAILVIWALVAHGRDITDA